MGLQAMRQIPIVLENLPFHRLPHGSEEGVRTMSRWDMALRQTDPGAHLQLIPSGSTVLTLFKNCFLISKDQRPHMQFQTSLQR